MEQNRLKTSSTFLAKISQLKLDASKSEQNYLDRFLSLLVVVFNIPCFIDHVKWYWFPNEYMWAHTEWLISYEGGFIRRGLSGELIKLLSTMFTIPPHQVIVILSVVTLFLVLIWTILLSRKCIPLYFILSSILIGGYNFAGILFYKDLFIILMYITSLYAITVIKNKIIMYIILNIISVSSILIHELYFFIGVPFLFVIVSIKFSNKLISIGSCKFFVLPIIAFFLVSYYSGNPEMAWSMINYWNELHQQVAPEYCCYELKWAFHALSYSWVIAHLPAQMYWLTKVHYGILWVPLIWILLWIFCGVFATKIIQHYDKKSSKIFQGLYIWHTISLVPLYILAYDWGRWILLTTLLSFLTVYIVGNSIQIPKIVTKFEIPVWNGKLVFWQKFLIIMFFGVPILWQGYENQIYVMPILNFLLR